MGTPTVYRITEDLFLRVLEDGVTFRIIEDGSENPPVTALGITITPGDIAKAWQPLQSYADWYMNGPSMLASGTDLQTALLNSLFSDRLATEDDNIPDDTDDRRGWWGDSGEKYPIGSRLWLLDRSKLTNNTGLEAEDYVHEALQWMIDDGVVASVNTQSVVQLPNALLVMVYLNRNDGTKMAQAFAWVWDELQ